MVQAGDRARLVLKVRDAARSDAREELDDHFPAQREIFGAIHNRAAALTDLLSHAVVRHHVSGHECTAV